MSVLRLRRFAALILSAALLLCPPHSVHAADGGQVSVQWGDTGFYDGRLSATVSGTEEGQSLIFALYSNKILVRTSIVAAKDGETPVEITVDAAADTARLFLWDTETMRPVCGMLATRTRQETPAPTPAPNIDTSRPPDSLKELRAANDAAIDRIAELPEFDGRSYGIVTKVRRQTENICWAYAVAGAAEINVLRKGIAPNTSPDSMHFNEQHLANALLNPALDPLGNNLPDYSDSFIGWYSGAGTSDAVYTMLRWNAPALLPVPNEERISKPAYLLENAVNLPNSDKDLDALKRAIVRYGGVAVSWYCNSGLYRRGCYNNDLSKGFYGSGHASVIVGWNDNVDKDRFYYTDGTPCPASRNGAWILKNSWGEGYGFSGYYYVSYDVLLSQCFALDMCSRDTYDNSYHYDTAATRSSSWALDPGERAAAMFEARTAFADRRECITGVNVAVNEGGNYKIKVKIYKNPSADFTDIYSGKNNPESGSLAAEAETDTLLYPGAYTVKFKEPVELEQNQVFSAVVELTNGARIRIVTDYEKSIENAYPANDMTFCNSGDGWSNTRLKGSRVAQIKVFTKNYDTPYKGNSLDYADVRFDCRSVPYSTEKTYPRLTVYFDGKALEEGRDYTVNYPNSVFPGRFEATVTGQGQYSGSRKIDYAIVQAPAPPNKPSQDLEVWGGYKTYKEIELPDGWAWGEPEETVVSGRTTWIIYRGPDAYCFKNTMADIRVICKNG